MLERAVFIASHVWMAGVFGFIGSFVGLLIFGYETVALIPGVILAALTVILLGWVSLKGPTGSESHSDDETALRWAQSASSQRERFARERLIATYGAGAVVSMHGLGQGLGQGIEGLYPSHNIDGTPMLPDDMGLDINGRVYGAPELVFPSHDHYDHHDHHGHYGHHDHYDHAGHSSSHTSMHD